MKNQYLSSARATRARAEVACLLLAGAVLPALSAGDSVRGAKVFSSECSECHSVKEGRNKKGPSLYAVLGRKAAGLPDVDYSDALRRSGWLWNEENLRMYLHKPTKETNPGTKMKYDGLRDALALEDLIAYLATAK